MKVLNKIMLFSLFLSTLIGCEDARQNNLTENKIYIPASGIVNASLYEIGDVVVYKTGVTKSGAFDVEATAQLAVATQEQLDNFNTAHKTNYTILPEACYALTKTNVAFVADAKQALVDINFNLPALKALDQTKKYALPIYLSSASLPMNEDFRLSVIVPIIEQPFVKLTVNGSASKSFDAKGVMTVQLPIEIPFENSWDIKCIFESTQAYFDEFNKANGNSYQMVPAEAYTINSPVITKGNKNVLVTITVDKSKLGYTSYALPVRMIRTEAVGVEGGFPVYNGKEDGDQNQFTATFNTSIDLIRDKWKMIDVSSESASEGTNGPASKMLDNNVDSFWHQAWEAGAQPPHYFTIDMGEGSEVVTISAIKFAARKGNDRVHNLEVFTSKDNKEWIKVSPDKPFVLKGNGNIETFILAKATEARYIKVSASDANAHLAEVWLFGFDPRAE